MRFIYTKAFGYFFAFLVVLTIVTFLEVKGFSGPIKGVFLNAPRPVISVVNSLAKPVRNFFATIYSLRKISEENIVLANRVHELEQQVVQLDQARKENEALKKELGFVAASPLVHVPCNVIAQNPLGLSDTIVINCGSDAGVEVGQAVVSQQHLVGKVIYTNANSSTVLLLTNSKFSADARISKTGSNGIVKGSFGSGILLDQVPQNQNVEKTQLVVTAGINDRIPKNILIGEVGDIISTQNDLFKKATLLSPIDFSDLQFVFVVK